MTLNLNIQSLSYTSSRIQVAFGSQAATGAPAAAPSAVDDRATLSPSALSAASSGPAGSDAARLDPAKASAAEPAPADATETAPRPTSRAAARAQALFTALDADKDGTVTKDEFTSGAKALLGRDGGPRRSGDDEDGERRVSRFERRLDRRLARAFDRVDGDDNGGISVEEMTAAFEKIGRGRRGGRPDGPPPPDGPPSADAPTAEPAPAAGASGASISIQITYVSIAIQRYTAVQGQTAAQPTATREAGTNGAEPQDAAAASTENAGERPAAAGGAVKSPGLLAA